MGILRPPQFPLRNMAEWSKWLQEQQIEAGLGNPDAEDRALTSTTGGERSWTRRLDNWPAQFRGQTNQTLGTSAITINLKLKDYDPGVHYALASNRVLIESAGYYMINYTVYASVNSLSGAADCYLRGSIHKNGVNITGSRSAAYISEVSLPDASCDGSLLVLLAAGDALRLRGRVSAAMDVSTVASRCKLIIQRVR